jgi:hypothetical protein
MRIEVNVITGEVTYHEDDAVVEQVVEQPVEQPVEPPVEGA